MDPVIVELNCPKELSGGWLYWPHWEDEPHTHTHTPTSLALWHALTSEKPSRKPIPEEPPSNPWNMASLHGRVARKIVRNLVSRVWQVVWRIQFANFSAPQTSTHTHARDTARNKHPPAHCTALGPTTPPPPIRPSTHLVRFEVLRKRTLK